MTVKIEPCSVKDSAVLSVTCKNCNKVFHTSPVSLTSIIAYMQGEKVQDAFPSMSSDDRELLISGMCPECFDNMFRED